MMKKAVLLLALLMIGGCASARHDDPDVPRQVCPSTTIGSEPKTFCY